MAWWLCLWRWSMWSSHSYHGGPGTRQPDKLTEGLIPVMCFCHPGATPTVLEPPRMSPTGEPSIQNMSPEGTLEMQTAVTNDPPQPSHSVQCWSALWVRLTPCMEPVRQSPIGSPFLSFLNLTAVLLSPIARWVKGIEGER